MLTIRNLGKTYEDGTRALSGIELQVEAGEILAVVGGSGCGKSTLLRLIAGLDRPTTGQVLVDGEVIAEPHPHVGVVFQEARLFPWLTVAENVGFGLRDLPAAERAAQVAAELERVGLGASAGRL
ncbi:ATP-binding cassette domain-containing protein, partial [Zavarzinia sp.]|uniref:ATP-binding cassette domain-containing protein n=1 Tax=Zavarzinia sp. TaxID=2027920 RepID=UPI003BB68515